VGQASRFSKLVSAVLFAAVCAYALAHLSEYVQNGRFFSLSEKTVTDSIALEGIALRSEQLLASEGEQVLSFENGKRIAADGSRESAIFFEDTDGYEYLKADEETFSPAKLDEFLSSEKRETDAAGRFIEKRTWYFAAYAEDDISCGEYKIRFDGFDEKQDCAVVKSLPAPEGKTAVLIRLRIGKNGYLHLRRCRGEIIRNEYSGLEVPVNAVSRDDDGNYFVNKLTAAGEKPCPVEIIYIGEDFYLINPTDELYAGARVDFFP